jgi:hypothetical protein
MIVQMRTRHRNVLDLLRRVLEGFSAGCIEGTPYYVVLLAKTSTGELELIYVLRYAAGVEQRRVHGPKACNLPAVRGMRPGRCNQSIEYRILH